MRIRAFVVSGSLIYQFEATVLRCADGDLVGRKACLDQLPCIGECLIGPAAPSVSVHRYRPKIQIGKLHRRRVLRLEVKLDQRLVELAVQTSRGEQTSCRVYVATDVNRNPNLLRFK
jgi:hypothetical protein